MKNRAQGPGEISRAARQLRSARGAGISLLLLLLLLLLGVLDEVSLDEELLGVLDELLSVVAGAVLPLAPVSVLLREPMLPEPSWRWFSVGVAVLPPGDWVLLSVAGSAEVDGVLAGVGAMLGLEAAVGELELGTLVCAMLRPAAATNATTAMMPKVLERSFIV